MTDAKKIEIRLLLLIVSQKLGAKAEKIISRIGVPVQYHVLAKGTASGELLDIMGLGGVDKTVITTVLSEAQAERTIKELKNKLYLGAPNTGVAVTIPLTGATSRVMNRINEEKTESVTHERKEEKMESNFSMIMAFVNQGFSEEVMSVAKPAGAKGGTVFHSRRVGKENTVQLFGISVQAEREIVLILAEKDKKKAIMQAISEKCGQKTEANGTVISLPVDSVVGIGLD